LKYLKVSFFIIVKTMSQEQESLDYSEKDIDEYSSDTDGVMNGGSEDESDFENENEKVGDDGDGEITGGGAEDSDNEENDDYQYSKQYKQSQVELSNNDDEDDDDDDDEMDENYLMKFDKEIRKNYLVDFHPEMVINNYDEIQSLVNISRDNRGVIIDDFHKTLPFLTKYEKTRVLGQRAKQINSGAKSYLDASMLIQNGKPIIDGYLIALKELELKRIPFIIRRPLPNGASEYWKLEDLELIN